MKKYCNYCKMRTDHIEDHLSSLCKRCGRVHHMGYVGVAGFKVKIPKYSTRTKI